MKKLQKIRAFSQKLLIFAMSEKQFSTDILKKVHFEVALQIFCIVLLDRGSVCCVANATDGTRWMGSAGIGEEENL